MASQCDCAVSSAILLVGCCPLGLFTYSYLIQMGPATYDTAWYVLCFKEIIHPNLKIQSLFTHPLSVSNLLIEKKSEHSWKLVFTVFVLPMVEVTCYRL